MFRPSRMIRRYLPKTVTTPTVACGTLRNIDHASESTRISRIRTRRGEGGRSIMTGSSQDDGRVTDAVSERCELYTDSKEVGACRQEFGFRQVDRSSRGCSGVDSCAIELPL